MRRGCRIAAALLLLVLAGLRPEPVVAAPPPDERLIVPGDRVGRLRLAGTLAEVVALHGPGVRLPSPQSLTATFVWESLGLRVEVNLPAGGLLGLTIFLTDANAWTGYATSDGLGLGSTTEQVMIRMAYGKPGPQYVGNLRYLPLDDLGIRFFFPSRGSTAGRVSEIRIAWPPRAIGDDLIVPGERISGVRLGMTVDEALAVTGDGYVGGGPPRAPGGRVSYYWEHLNLGVMARDGRVVRVYTTGAPAGQPPRFATATGLRWGSSWEVVRRNLGDAVEVDHTEYRWGRETWRYPWRGVELGIARQSADPRRIFVSSVAVVPRRWLTSSVLSYAAGVCLLAALALFAWHASERLALTA